MPRRIGIIGRGVRLAPFGFFRLASKAIYLSSEHGAEVTAEKVAANSKSTTVAV